MLKNYKTLIIIFSITIIITLIVSLVFIDLGNIEDDPITAFRNRAGYIFIIQANLTFSSVNFGAQNFLELKKIYLKDKEA